MQDGTNNPPRIGIEYGIFTGKSIYEKVIPKEPIIEGILNRGENLIISAKQGVGKSILALQLVHNLTSGTDFLDTYRIPKARTVLLAQTEGDRAETINRTLHMSKALKLNNDMWAHYNVAGIMLNTYAGYKEFVDTIAMIPFKYDVIIIDCVYPTVKGSLNDDDVATEWQRNVRLIKEKHPGSSFIGMYHDSNKEHWVEGRLIKEPADNLFGTSMWGNWVSSNYKMEKHDSLYKLIGGKGDGKGRSGQNVREIHMKLMEPSPLYFELVMDGLSDTELKILSMLKVDETKRYRRIQLEDLIEKSKPTVCRALVNLQKADKIDKFEEEGLVYYKIKKGAFNG